jgi:glycosyltransferase involved in cell wall biosynthesis
VPVWEELRARLDGALTVVAGEENFGGGVRLGAGTHSVRVVSNRFILGNRLVWQRGCVRELQKPQILVLELSPRILSSWLILLGRRMRRRPSVLFGHAWPRKGREARSDHVRQLLRRLADGIIVYTDSQARELAERMPGKLIRAAPNSLYSRALAVKDPDRRPARNVLFVGRLVPAKKPLLLVEAFHQAIPSLPEDATLVFVGDGPLRATIETEASRLGIADRVRCLGHIIEYERLRDLYANALVSVSPGYAGLSLTQSHWFGVPSIVARDEPHAPEIEAAEPGVNVVYVDSDSPGSLSRALVDVYTHREEWLARAPAIARSCVERYSLEAMVEAMVDVIEAL